MRVRPLARRVVPALLAPTVAATLAAALPASARTAVAAPPARAPAGLVAPGCTWQDLSAGGLRVRAQACPLPTGRWRLEPDGALPGFVLRRDDERIGTVLRVFRLEPGERLASLLPRLRREGLIPDARTCRFVRAQVPPPRPGWAVWEIRPTGERRRAFERTPKDQVPEPPCGEAGWSTHGVRWFAMAPARPDRVVYGDEGQDGSFFDPTTLELD
ncbi:MAG: hypothetical protein RJA99_1199 [Pseudomonadota bacterium]|jgi:hypothetical protein